MPKLFQTTTIWLPTLWGWLLILCVLALLLVLYIKKIHSFLAINQPVNAEVLIVEGWMRDYALKQAADIVDGNNTYKKILVTGGRLDRGEYLSEYKTFAPLSKASLVKMGVQEDKIVVLPTPYTHKDRTWNSSLEVKRWFETNKNYRSANLITVGIHARRSYAIFRKVLPAEINLGVISVSYDDYDTTAWWKTSVGVRWVLSEQIAYLYFRLFG